MDENASVNAVVRTLGAAWRALRLYPPSSPLPLQAAEAVCAAITVYIEAAPSLRLVVASDGFVLRGVDGVFTSPGVPDLADALGAHGVAEVDFVAPPLAEEVLAFLTSSQMQPGPVQKDGGLQAVLANAGVGAMIVVPVAIARVDAVIEIPEEDAAKFLAELAADPDRLAIWLRALLTYEDEALVEGLQELESAVGSAESLGRSVAAAFHELDGDSKDRLLEVSIDLEPVREVTGEMLANLSAIELVSAIRGGRYGRNLMSISAALARLPVRGRSGELLHEATEALRAADTPEAQIAFLERMVAARVAPVPEPPLVEARPVYRSMLEAARLRPEHVEAAKRDVAAHARIDAAGVATLLRLLDLAEDLGSFGRVLDALARAVPHLLEAGDPDLALDVAGKVSNWSTTYSKPWPELDERLARATEDACGERSMCALLDRYPSREDAVRYAKDLVGLGGEKGARALADAAMDSEAEDAMETAELVLGRRLPELLAPDVARAEARHAAKLARLLARDGGPQCMQALGQLISRPEDKVRTETAKGVCTVGGAAASTLVPRLLRDPSPEVSLITVHALARYGGDLTVPLLAARLAELDDDEKHLTLARAIIGVLASSPADAATEALHASAGQGSFLRKKRSAEIRQLAKDALTARERGRS